MNTRRNPILSVFISKAKLRRLRLVEYLSNQIHPVTYRQLTKKFKTNRRAVYEDLNYLKGKYPDMRIYTTSDTVMLYLPHGYRIDYFYNLMTRESTAFALLDALFHQASYDRQELIDELDISQSTLYRIAQQLNSDLLERFNIALEITPVRLTGDEADIRAFYTQLYFEVFDALEWPFEPSEKEVEELLLYFTNTFELELDFGRKRLWMTIAMVNLARTKQESFVNNSKDGVADYYVDRLSNEEHQDFVEKFYQTAGLDFNKSNIKQLFYPFLEQQYYLYLADHESNDLQTKKFAESKSLLADFIDQFITKFPLELKNKDQLVLDLQQALVFEHHELFINTINVDRGKKFNDRIKKVIPEAFAFAEENLAQFYHDWHGELNQNSLDYLIYTFFIKFEGLFDQLSHIKHSVKALVVTDTHLAHCKFIEEWFRYRVGRILEIQGEFSDRFSLETAADSDYDIIISNFYIPPIKGKHILWVDDYPSATNYSDLIQLLNVVKQDKGLIAQD